MRNILAFLVLVSLFSSNHLIAKKRKRVKKSTKNAEKFVTSIGYNIMPALFSKTVDLGYKIHPKIEIGGSLLFIDREDFLEGQVRTPLSCDNNPDNYSINSCVKYKKNSPLFFRIFVKIFPFSNGFFTSAYLGKFPDLSQKNIFLPSLEDSFYSIGRVSSKNAAITYTIETVHNYYLAISAGWKWRFARNFFFGFDAGLMKEIHPKRNIYFYGDLRGLDPANTPDLVDIYYLNQFSYLPFKERRRTSPHVNLSIGITF